MMTESRRKTKRKVDLVSSHSDNDNEDGPLFAIIDNGSPASALYQDDRNGIPSYMRYKPGAGQTVVYEDYYIPDVD